jgi:hypothetical protein
MVAEVACGFRVGNGFLVGDAAHRMTPAGALGMNTAIQSAHNLGWKLAWVAHGWAGDALLDSYHAERQPAGERNARRSLQLREIPPPTDAWITDLDQRYASAVIAPAGPYDKFPYALLFIKVAVGTGGRDHGPLGFPIPNSQLSNADTYGVLKLTLAPGKYTWEFVPVEGGAFHDSGEGPCHNQKTPH